MPKIAVIGEYRSICGFGALGVDAFNAETADDVSRLLRRLTSNDYGIIYVSESLIKQCPKEYDKYKDMPLPAVIPIPDRVSSDFAENNIRQAVIRAVGSDII